MIPDIHTLSIDEKMLTMSALWKEMREKLDSSEETEEIKGILKERVSRVESGQAELLEWDSVKARIGRQ